MLISEISKIKNKQIINSQKWITYLLYSVFNIMAILIFCYFCFTHKNSEYELKVIISFGIYMVMFFELAMLSWESKFSFFVSIKQLSFSNRNPVSLILAHTTASLIELKTIPAIVFTIMFSFFNFYRLHLLGIILLIITIIEFLFIVNLIFDILLEAAGYKFNAANVIYIMIFYFYLVIITGWFSLTDYFPFVGIVSKILSALLISNIQTAFLLNLVLLSMITIGVWIEKSFIYRK